MLKDLISKVSVVLGLKAQVLTADAQGAAFDCQDDLGMMIVANVGLSADTLSGSVKIELAVEESDDASIWTAVADADLTAAVAGGAQTGTFAVIDAAAEDEATYKVGYKGYKRYARAIVNLVGTHTNGTPVAINYHGLPMKLPA